MRRLVDPLRRAREISAGTSGLYRGTLSEDYDGIGQYVLVSLANSSVGAAYKARIAAGDFGGGRTFPRGTPVTLNAIHGQLEVLSLGNIPGGCTIVFPEETDPGGWGTVFGVPTEPSNQDWVTTMCSPGDDWYFSADPSLFYVEDDAAVIDLSVAETSFTFDNPWTFYRLGGPDEAWEVGEEASEFLIKCKIEMPSVSTPPDTVQPQIDFYICTDDRMGSVGTVGDVYYVTLDFETVPSGGGLGVARYPNLRTGFFSNASMGYPGITDSADSLTAEYTYPDFALWNVDIYIRWRMERDTDGKVDLMARAWPVEEEEPEDWPAYWTKIDDTNWRGARTFVVGPYYVSRFIAGTPFVPTRYFIYSVQDLFGKLCVASEDREIDPCNG